MFLRGLFDGLRRIRQIPGDRYRSLPGSPKGPGSNGINRMLSHQSFLFSHHPGVPAGVINPLLIANFAKRSLRKTKTDKKDARTIAKFLMENREEICQLSVSQDLQDLRDLPRERESLSHLISATKVEMKRVLRTIFPELESIGDIYTRVMLHFLQAYPSARLVKAAKLKVLAQALRQPYVGNKLTFSAEGIFRAAQSSVATASLAKEIILKGKIATLCIP